MNDELRWYQLTRKRSELLLLDAVRGFRRHEIEPILIKGWAAARNYPENKPRFFGDIDIAVSAADFERSAILLQDPESGIKGVDLHCELRHMDTLAWPQLYSNSELIDLEDEKIRVLSAEDHLRVICVHWLTDGGENRERLWDIYYAVQNRPPGFDWEKCLNLVSDNRRGWIIATVGLAHKYLQLSLEGIPFAEEARELPAWLTQTIEKEWERAVRLRPLHTALGSRKVLLEQIRKRIPPNPIQATIDCEGSFHASSRVGYQIRDTFKRLGPSLKRVLPVIVKK